MDNEAFFKVVNEFGEEIECEVLFTYEDANTNKYYIAYTDNSLDEDGVSTRVFASTFDPNEESPILHPIETEEEWQKIEELLESLSEEDEEDDDEE